MSTRNPKFLVPSLVLLVVSAALVGGSQASASGSGAVGPSSHEREIRPGLQISVEGHGYCTANFVFRGTGDREGKTYLGTAAHCVERDIGADVHAPPELGFYTGEDGPVIGQVAYSSFEQLGVVVERCFLVLSCAEDAIDFALVEIAPDHVDEVDPAMLGFGGPTGVVPFEEIAVGDRVLTYGNTPLRPGPGELDAREGYVVGKEPPHGVTVYTLTPGTLGDSGSGVMSGDGRALGVLSTVEAVPPQSSGLISLSKALDLAASGGWHVELATSDVVDAGVFPDLGG